MICIVLCAAGPAAGQIDRGLGGPSRWREQAYGMSLAVPPDSGRVEQTQDGALVKFLTQDAATISVYIRRSPTELSLPAVKDKALRELGFRYPSAVTLVQDRQPVHAANREALGLYLLVPDDKRGDWVIAQVYTLIDPNTLAIFQLDCDADRFDRAQQVFKTLIDSVELADPAELDRVRAQRIQAGQAWLDSITPGRVKSAIIPEQWLRIIQGGKDVGYMRIRQFDEADHVPPGTSVSVRSRVVDGENTYDTEGSFFEADDRSVEFWTITTTLRVPQNIARAPNTPPQPATHNWRQTGLRDGQALEVSQETPTSIKKLSWKISPAAYLSLVDQYVLPALLPRDQPTELAFYAFNQNARKLSLRTFRIEPMPGGGYRVYDRPTPDRTERVATYDHHGRLIERKMSNGRTYLATTPQELKRIWGTL